MTALRQPCATDSIPSQRPRRKKRTKSDDMAKRAPALPPHLPARGLSRTQAAAYIGLSPSLFDMMVADGRTPGPTRLCLRP